MSLAASVRQFLRRFVREAPCMDRKWEVRAMWLPPVRKVMVRGIEQVIAPKNGPAEFKFTVAGGETEVEVVAAVMESGFFGHAIRKQFGFVAKEIT